MFHYLQETKMDSKNVARYGHVSADKAKCLAKLYAKMLMYGTDTKYKKLFEKEVQKICNYEKK